MFLFPLSLIFLIHTNATNTAMMKLSARTLSALALAATTTPGSVAYVLLPSSNTVPSSSSLSSSSLSSRRYSPLFASSSEGGESESAFVAIADDVDDDDDKNFDVVEKFGKGAAKVRAICCSFSVEAKDMDLGRNSGDLWATHLLGGNMGNMAPWRLYR